MNSVVVVFDGRRVTKSFDGTTSVADVFAFASLHFGSPRQSCEQSDFRIYVHGQRVSFTDTVGDLRCSEIMFVRTPAAKSAVSQPSTKRSAVRKYGDTVREVAWQRLVGCVNGEGRSRLQPSAELSLTEFPEVAYPVVLGSVVQWLGAPQSQSETHSWTVYIRGHKNENLGSIIEYVEFKLHDTFANPLRRLESPPFEVSERGWGQFTVFVTVGMRNVEGPGKRLSMSHFIAFSPGLGKIDFVTPRAKTHCVPPHGQLYAKPAEVIPPFALVKQPVVTERADELVVRNPTPTIRDAFAKLHEATASIRGSGTQGAGGVTVWPDVKGHLALPPGEAWANRLTPEAEAIEYAELCTIRDLLATEVATTLGSASQTVKKT